MSNISTYFERDFLVPQEILDALKQNDGDVDERITQSSAEFAFGNFEWSVRLKPQILVRTFPHARGKPPLKL